MNTFSELRAEEVQEMLARPPRWLLRWGITVAFLVIALVFVGAWFIHYPDLVRASFKLTSASVPKAVLARSDGKVVRLLVQDGQTVKTGSSLAYLESTARHDEIIRLSHQLANAWNIARQGNLEGLDKLDLSHYNHLGELQNAYQTFEQNHIQLRAYLANGFFSQKKAILRQEIKDLQALTNNLRQQQKIQERDQALAEEDYATQKQLADQKSLTPLELKREESKLIGRRFPYQQTALALISNLTAQRVKEKEMLELDRQVTEERDKFLLSLSTFQSAVDGWKLRYILTAPVSGRVMMVGSLQENQSVVDNQEVFYVAPPSTDYFGELRIPQQNAGKVQVGQTVLVKFTGYPYQEFGALRGRITYIADIPLRDSVFLARVQLPSDLKTTYNRTLAYKTGMTASADILNNDSRLLEKLFYQFRHVFNGM
ncbi:HlyD family secretion protein [Spirosoma oryzicola]|uniref:HlyD family secretion protein n=1 Tax=Spirosoma oryzicola TaxID=2898794 RepID=UPI001E3A4C84|nr:HlyD family efflux transporter periplasmic adaptor subunit [Spirosoma oryzicola]UHG94587.1 HlyD family secretion protein [Spirosoma oryzicola]